MRKPAAAFPLALLLVLASCSKDPEVEHLRFNITQNCSDELPQFDRFGPGYYSDSSRMSAAQFNPNNPAELLYYNRFDQNIYIYDRNTRRKRLLANCPNLTNLRWGRNDHILVENGLIQSIKSNGDSVRVYFGGYDSEWNAEGTKFVYAANLPYATNMVYDFRTGEVDTLPFLIGYNLNWQNRQNKIVSYSSQVPYHHFMVTDMNKMSIEPVLETSLETEYTIGSPCWIGDHEFLYASNWRLFSYNTETREKKLLANHCALDQIGVMSYAPATNEVVATLSHVTYKSARVAYLSSRIMILNFNNDSVTFIDP